MTKRALSHRIVQTLRTRARPQLPVDGLLLLGLIGIALGLNQPLWHAALAGHLWSDSATWRFAGALFVLFVSLHFCIYALIATRHTVQLLLAVSTVIAILGNHFISHYGVALDPSMMRNALATDWREARELLNADFIRTALLAAVLAPLPWFLRVSMSPSWSKAIQRRFFMLFCAAAMTVGSLWFSYQGLSALMRNNHTLRYQISPANVIWSLGRVLVNVAHSTVVQDDPPEPVHRTVAAHANHKKPTLLVMIIGETARAANFSLNGYARDTNPELIKRDITYFPNVIACGTSTEVSLPCMFSPFGRSDYDEVRIRHHESLLHLLSRAGLHIVWLDNQSGCKGVCTGLEFQDLSHRLDADLCAKGRCFDEILLRGLQNTAQHIIGDTVVVLHAIGNHGPAYYRRYPSKEEYFKPACTRPSLNECTAAEITNAYDNAIRYTDHFVASVIDALHGMTSQLDTALVYVSDHGESLGEHGLYLHGIPYRIAPKEQIEVPMLWWLAPQSTQTLNVDMSCLKQRAREPTSHDDLFHSVLGLLNVSTPSYQQKRDMFHKCRQSHTAVAT